MTAWSSSPARRSTAISRRRKSLWPKARNSAARSTWARKCRTKPPTRNPQKRNRSSGGNDVRSRNQHLRAEIPIARDARVFELHRRPVGEVEVGKDVRESQSRQSG